MQRSISLGAVILIALLCAGAGWAVPGDLTAPTRPAKERPILLACTSDQQLKWKQCVDGGRAGCMLLADQSQHRGCVEKINATCSSQLGIQC